MKSLLTLLLLKEKELITYWYFILSKKTNVDIKSELNKWLYDYELN